MFRYGLTLALSLLTCCGAASLASAQQLKTTIKHKVYYFNRVALHPEGKLLVAESCCSTKLTLWDVETGELKATFQPEKSIKLPVGGTPLSLGDLHSWDLSPDGKLLAAGLEGNVQLFDAQTGRRLRTILFPNDHVNVIATNFSPNGKVLLAYGVDQFRIINPVSGRYTTKKSPLTKDPRVPQVPNSNLFSPDGKTLAAGMDEETVVRLIDLATWKERLLLKGRNRWVDDDQRVISFSPDGKTLAAPGNEDEHVILWDTATGEVKTTLSHERFGNANVEFVLFSPDGKTLVVATPRHKKAWFCDPETGEVKTTVPIEGDENKIRSASFSADGRLFAAPGPARATISIWDLTKR